MLIALLFFVLLLTVVTNQVIGSIKAYNPDLTKTNTEDTADLDDDADSDIIHVG